MANKITNKAIDSDNSSRGDYYSQMKDETKQQQKDMLFATKLQNELARTQTLTKIMTKGSDVMKDTIK